MTVDKQKHGDDIVWLHGIKLLLSQKVAARFNYYRSITVKNLAAHFSYKRCST
jgi:hypothetical protein